MNPSLASGLVPAGVSISYEIRPAREWADRKGKRTTFYRP